MPTVLIFILQVLRIISLYSRSKKALDRMESMGTDLNFSDIDKEGSESGVEIGVYESKSPKRFEMNED